MIELKSHDVHVTKHKYVNLDRTFTHSEYTPKVINNSDNRSRSQVKERLAATFQGKGETIYLNILE